MFKRLFMVVTLVAALAAPAIAQQRIIVRTENGTDGPTVIRKACENVKCQVRDTLDGSDKQVFVVAMDETATTTTTTTYSGGGLLGGLLTLVIKVLSPILNLLSQPGVESAEHDQFLRLHADDAGDVPSSLYDKTEVDYYGTKVRRGYVEQPAVGITALDDVRRAYSVTGSGVVVGVIDTGVDPKHAALINVLLPGYDFTRNITGGSELGDVDQSTAAMVDRRGYTNQSTAAMVDDERPAYVNQSTAAMVDQSTAAMVDNPEFAAFGHGTMVAGVVHLVAPEAKILPLKAFKSDGSGFGSDVIRAIYYAANNGANVVNMSFSFQSSSRELERACYYAARRGLILVASTGNEGRRITRYPAGYSTVMGIASTNDRDYRSDFSNYGYSVVWVAAPGEAIVTTYPYDHYAATWGTSFSTPFVAGAAALLRDVKPLNTEQAKRGLSNARWINFDMGKGRVDMFRAVQYWRQINWIR